jgi:hypothetical protein
MIVVIVVHQKLRSGSFIINDAPILHSAPLGGESKQAFFAFFTLV